MTKTILIFLLAIILSLMSCQKDEKKIYTTLDSIETKEYYNAEIFTQPYLSIYGKWKLFATSGGFSGTGIDLNFDYLEIRKYGVYGLTQNGNLLEYGKIIITPQTNENRLKVYLEKDEYSNLLMRDNEKYIDFYGSDTLFLSAPCCDRINYHFIREK